MVQEQRRGHHVVLFRQFLRENVLFEEMEAHPGRCVSVSLFERNGTQVTPMKFDVDSSSGSSRADCVQDVPTPTRDVEDPNRSLALACFAERSNLTPYPRCPERNAIDAAQGLERMHVTLTFQPRIIHEFGLTPPNREIRRRQADHVHQFRQTSLDLPVPRARTLVVAVFADWQGAHRRVIDPELLEVRVEP